MKSRVSTTAFGLIAASALSRAWGQVLDNGLVQKYGSNYLFTAPTMKTGNAWTLRPWTGAVAPYRAARADLEGSFAKPAFDAEGEFARLGVEARKKPADPLAQFRWATLGFLIAQREGDRGVSRWGSPQGNATRARIRWALALAPDPANAEYDRIRFLFDAAASRAELFRELGKRLVLRWPDDDALLRNQAENLAVSTRENDVDKAVAIADSLFKKHPHQLRYVSFKGDIYRSAWISLHRRADGLADIEWTERYLKMAGPKAYNREGLRRATNSLREQLGLPLRET